MAYFDLPVVFAVCNGDAISIIGISAAIRDCVAVCLAPSVNILQAAFDFRIIVQVQVEPNVLRL